MTKTQTPNENLLGRLTEIFREVLDDDTLVLTVDTIADEVEDWDSVSHISLMLATEEAFGIRLNAAEVGGLANVGQLIDIIANRATS